MDYGLEIEHGQMSWRDWAKAAVLIAAVLLVSCVKKDLAAALLLVYLNMRDKVAG
jgi:hypothetical protein